MTEFSVLKNDELTLLKRERAGLVADQQAYITHANARKLAGDAKGYYDAIFRADTKALYIKSIEAKIHRMLQRNP